MYILTLCILNGFSIHIDTISMGLSIVYFKGSQVEFSCADPDGGRRESRQGDRGSRPPPLIITSSTGFHRN